MLYVSRNQYILWRGKKEQDIESHFSRRHSARPPPPAAAARSHRRRLRPRLPVKAARSKAQRDKAWHGKARPGHAAQDGLGSSLKSSLGIEGLGTVRRRSRPRPQRAAAACRSRPQRLAARRSAAKRGLGKRLGMGYAEDSRVSRFEGLEAAGLKKLRGGTCQVVSGKRSGATSLC